MIECIVFDLDGTLVNSHNTIYKATVKTLEYLNLKSNLDKEKFYNLLGHHFQDIFNECEIDVPDVEHFINIYKGFYFDFIDESHLYDNAFTLFEELKKRKIKTGLLTTKGHDQAEKISNHFKFDKYLDVIEGRKNGIAIKPAPDQLLKICKEVNVEPKNTLMIGDTELDILCGKSAGAKTCAVSFGYRNVEELKTYKPDYMINNLLEILKII
ncbi:MAG: HAD family hydrolase [Ignavibacteriales bacterium]|nr:HAD family hydrolase [Ignavibacteriales bacterium]